MNPHSDSRFPNASEFPGKSGLAPYINAEGDGGPELEPWEPPFERWVRLADDLLRDWHHGSIPERRA